MMAAQGKKQVGTCRTHKEKTGPLTETSINRLGLKASDLVTERGQTGTTELRRFSKESQEQKVEQEKPGA